MVRYAPVSGKIWGVLFKRECFGGFMKWSWQRTEDSQINEQTYTFFASLEIEWISSQQSKHDISRRRCRSRLLTPDKPEWFTFPVFYQPSSSMQNDTSFSEGVVKKSCHRVWIWQYCYSKIGRVNFTPMLSQPKRRALPLVHYNIKNA